MIEIRRIDPEEYPLVRRINTVVYNGRHDFSREEAPDPLAYPHRWIWAVFEDGKMVSSLAEIPYLMRFDGHDARMSGIGGVGTLPEARKGGNIRRIFEKLFSEAYEEGVVFSSLTPFSHAFYRKFGYELACSRNEVRIPAGEFAGLPVRGEFTQIFPGDDTADLQRIHGAYIADINQGIRRDFWPENRAWRIFTRDDPYATGTYLYLWRDEAGNPGGYIKYQDVTENEGHLMSVRELAFTCRDALYGVLGILSGLSAQFKTLLWLMPTFLDPADFGPPPWDISQRIVPRDMARVINVKAALELMRKPAGEGAYVLEAVDPQIPANQGKFLVEYGPEGVRVSSTKKEAGIRCDIPVLSQLITGYRTLENALRTKRQGLELSGSREILDKVFTLRPQHITEYF
ncbi:MAG: GNAT family N-acetyltransferase [Treponema sp.]|jgi:predicted acetyltransferase|nr:GNAT family N-acetyltransferase [Treponema sp.]